MSRFAFSSLVVCLLFSATVVVADGPRSRGHAIGPDLALLAMPIAPVTPPAHPGQVMEPATAVAEADGCLPVGLPGRGGGAREVGPQSGGRSPPARSASKAVTKSASRPAAMAARRPAMRS